MVRPPARGLLPFHGAAHRLGQTARDTTSPTGTVGRQRTDNAGGNLLTHNVTAILFSLGRRNRQVK
jgi:hypothetical protein